MTGISLPNTTPVPNEIINGWAKKLSGSELKILLVVVRKTLGWVLDPTTGMRKEEDWINYKQLQNLTGLHPQAISRAIDKLISDYKLVQARDEQGNVLDTTGKRKIVGQKKQKIFYRLNLLTLSQTSHYFENHSSNHYENHSGTTMKIIEPTTMKITSIQNQYILQNQILQNILVRYQEKILKNSRLTDSAKEKIKTRLLTFSEVDLLQAIDNFSADDWYVKNCGWRGMAWFFHSDDRIEKFVNLKPRTKQVSNKDYKGGEYGKYVS